MNALDVARGQLGNTDPSRYWQAIDPSLAGDNWCACFVSYCFQTAGAPLPKMYESSVASGYVYCPDGVRWAKDNGWWVTMPRQGDIALYCWDGSGTAEHTGIVETVNADGSIVAIEGNTGNPAGVYRETRKSNVILGFIRPGGAMAVKRGVDSAYGPTSADVSQAKSEGIDFWAWYVGGPGCYHVWTDAEVAIIDSMPESLPVWVPALDLSGNPSQDYSVARTRAHSLGWYGAIALDTEASMRGNARLQSYVDGWNAAAAAAGDPQVVYGGGNYVGSAHAWWIVNSTTPPAGECYQNGSGNVGSTSVDFDYADASFPLATRNAPTPPAPTPAPTYQTIEGDADVATRVVAPIKTDSNGSGYTDIQGDPNKIVSILKVGLDPQGAHVYETDQGMSFTGPANTTGVTRIILADSDIKSGTVTAIAWLAA